MATNFESMTLDELIDWRVAAKGSVRKAQVALKESDEVYRAKVHEMHRDEGRTQLQRAAEAEGNTVEQQARIWMNGDDLGRQRQGRLFLTGSTREVVR